MRRDKGFTLVELLVVVVIIGILASVAIPNFAGAQDKAKNSAVQAAVHAIQLALEQYGNDNNCLFPVVLSDTILIVNGGYLVDDAYPKTPWGTQQAPGQDITWTNVQMGGTEGVGVPGAPVAINYFGAVSYICTDGSMIRSQYDIGGTGKKGEAAIRASNIRNH